MSAIQQRIISGVSISTLVLALMALDAWLAGRAASSGYTAPATPMSWLSNGALSTGLLLALTALTAREVTHFVRLMDFRPNRFIIQLFSLGLVAGPYVSFNLGRDSAWYDESWGMIWLSLALGLAFLAQAARRGTEHATVNVASTLFVIIYTGGLAGYLVRLRMEIGGTEGAILLLYSVFLVKANDIGALFTGMALGKHKLIPWLSPKKTWEGFFGGLLTAMLLAWPLGACLPGTITAGLNAGPLPSTWILLLFGLLMGLLSVAGDLTASLLKRDARLKDSGEVIPGMGGILDIFDSPLLAAPAVWFFWTRIMSLTINT